MRDPDSTFRITRLLVIVIDGTRRDEGEYLCHSLEDQLESRHVPRLAQLIYRPADLRRYAPRMDAFGANAVLEFSLKQVSIYKPSGVRFEAFYDVSLFSPANPEKRFWRAHVVSNGPESQMDRRLDMMAEAVIRQLQDDGFFDGKRVRKPDFVPRLTSP